MTRRKISEKDYQRHGANGKEERECPQKEEMNSSIKHS
jgi:hypothetical protein